MKDITNLCSGITQSNTAHSTSERCTNTCRSDVDILRKGCLKLRELFLQVANIDPFQYITIASVCSAIYRNECLPENSIGIVNEVPSDNYSIKSMKWMKYLSQRHGISIRHACNGGEQAIKFKDGKVLKVDGFCKENNITAAKIAMMTT